MDVGLVFGLLAFCFYQASNLTSREIQAIYEKRKSWIPSYVFGPIWLILYLCIFFSGYYAFTSPQDTNYFVAMVALFIVNLFLNKYWTVAFFDMERTVMALMIASLLLATAIGELVLMGLSELWLSFGLYMAYAVWLIVALVLNFQWVCGSPSSRKGGDGDDNLALPISHQPRPFVVPPRMPRKGLVKNL